MPATLPDIDAHRWWHTIDLAPDVSTPGSWDLRPTSELLPWPDVAGKRCLDIGAARRGATGSGILGRSCAVPARSANV